MFAVITDQLGIDEFDAALTCALAALRAGADRDWKVPAGTLTWTCWRTLEHLVDVLYSYAFQIAARSATDVLLFEELKASSTAPATGLIDGLAGMGNLLSAILRATPPDGAVEWMGEQIAIADWAPRSTRELLLHTFDITQGLGVAFEPPMDQDTWATIVRDSGRPFSADERDAWHVASAERRARPAPAGSEDGLVSDFAGGDLSTKFGSGWRALSDSAMDGTSSADIAAVEGGAPGASHSLRAWGELTEVSGWHWGGAMFLAGPSSHEAANVSSKTALSFWARGDGHPFAIWALTPSGIDGRKGLRVTRRWAPYEVALADLGTDGTTLRGILFAAEGAPGPFEFQLGEVRFD